MLQRSFPVSGRALCELPTIAHVGLFPVGSPKESGSLLRKQLLHNQHRVRGKSKLGAGGERGHSKGRNKENQAKGRQQTKMTMRFEAQVHKRIMIYIGTRKTWRS